MKGAFGEAEEAKFEAGRTTNKRFGRLKAKDEEAKKAEAKARLEAEESKRSES